MTEILDLVPPARGAGAGVHPGDDTPDATGLLDRLVDRGIRITPQRRAIAAALTGEHVHLTAEEVLARARAVLPEVSQATVYATLAEWVELGEVGEVTGDGRRRFDPNVHRPHHHLVCRGCGAILDVELAGTDALAVVGPGPGARTVAVESAEVTLRGLCPACTA